MVKAAKAAFRRGYGRGRIHAECRQGLLLIITDFKAKGVDVFMLNCNYTEGGSVPRPGRLRASTLSGITGITVGPDSLYSTMSSSTLAQGRRAEGDLCPGGLRSLFRRRPRRPRRTWARHSPRPNTRPCRARSPSSRTRPGGLLHLVLTKQARRSGRDAWRRSSLHAKAAKFEGAGGHYEWDSKGDVKNRTFAVVQVKGGKFVSTGQSVNQAGLEKLRG